jgi:hypothetical protein
MARTKKEVARITNPTVEKSDWQSKDSIEDSSKSHKNGGKRQDGR